jgi:citrate lyase subunit beta / citryl-CoA lyase
VTTVARRLAYRSWLYAPGDNAKLVERVFAAGSDAVVLDLEDAVPEANKERARTLVAGALRTQASWVRINRAGTDEARRDVDAVGADACGLRIPKVESAEDIEWVHRLRPAMPLVATIETAIGVTAAAEIASHSAVYALALGAADLMRDLSLGGSDIELLYVRSQLVVVSRAAGIAPPIDSVHLDTRDLAGLRSSALRARALGFFGKSAIHPGQVAVINEAFTPTMDEVARARAIVQKFEASGGLPTTHEGLFIDAPVVARAQDIIQLDGANR